VSLKEEGEGSASHGEVVEACMGMCCRGGYGCATAAMMKRGGGSCRGGARRRREKDSPAWEMSMEEGDPAKMEVVWWWLGDQRRLRRLPS